MRELSLFTGAGGGLYASLLLGWEPVCAVEKDPYRRKVLEQRQRDGIFPRFPIFEDVRSFDGVAWRGKVDVVSGGFPCQPFSTAPHGRWKAVNLWAEMFRVVRETSSRFVFAENVQRAPIKQAANDLAWLGYMVRCCRMPASFVGAPHRRERYWLLADADGFPESREPLDAEVAGIPAPCPSEWWQDFSSEVLGMDDGVAGRSERLQALGDGQVPLVAASAFRLLESRIG